MTIKKRTTPLSSSIVTRRNAATAAALAREARNDQGLADARARIAAAAAAAQCDRPGCRRLARVKVYPMIGEGSTRVCLTHARDYASPGNRSELLMGAGQ